MSEAPCPAASLTEAQLLQRLEQFERTRACFIAVWLQNPALGRQTGARMQSMLAPLVEVSLEDSVQRATTVAR